MRYRSIRGFSFAELVVGIAVLFLFFAFAWSTLLPVIEYMGATRAKGDTQANVIPFLYKLERDFHNSDAAGIFYDNSGATALPTPGATPGATLVSVTTFAVPTAVSGVTGGACDQYTTSSGTHNFFQMNPDGAPNWQGFNVFLLRSGSMSCVFESESFASCLPANPCSSAAGSAITAAKAVSSPPPYASGIESIQLAADRGKSSNILEFVDMKVISTSTEGGRTNETTYAENIQARN